MTTTNEDLLGGSLSGAAKTDGGSGIKKRIKSYFNRICRKQRNLQIINQHGGSIYLVMVDNTKEEISQLIMEYNNLLNSRKP